MIDFSLTPDVAHLRDRVRDFVNATVIPREPEISHSREGLEQVRRELQAEAKVAHLFVPHMPRELGGLELDWRATSVVFEEAGRSLLGPHALNAAAPDEGNMHLLNEVGTAAQKEQFLVPLARGDVRSCFAMTEPPPGAGSDPSMLRSRAERKGGQWVINGAKRFITGAGGAAFSIVLARAPQGPTMFLVDTGNSGFCIRRTIPTMDSFTPGGHCEVDLVDCTVDDDAVLGEVGKGYEYAQVRLDPARLTHCMRWLGIAVRSMEIAASYALHREGFGSRLADHQGVQWVVADAEMDIHACRLMIWHAAWMLDTGQRARHHVSMTKTFVSEAVDRVVDGALQLCGALGVSEDVPISHFYREVRAFRIYDGPSEVHRSAVARRVFRKLSEA